MSAPTPSDLINLAKDHTAQLPSSIPHSTLASYLTALPPSIPVTAYLSAILTLLSQAPPSPSLSSLIFSLLSSALTLPNQNDGSFTALSLFSPHLKLLSKPQISSVLKLVLSSIANGDDDVSKLDLLPHLVNQENADGFVDSILAINWSNAVLIKLVSVLKDFPEFQKSRVSEVFKRVFVGMRRVEIQDLPLIVYQLLVLASKGAKWDRKEILRGILGFFEKLEKGNRNVVRQIEGTVLMHVNFAVKQDLGLGNEVIGIFKHNFGAINHFAITVLLSIGRVRRYSESAIGVLKAGVVGSQKDYKISRGCKWLPDKLKEECADTAKHVENAFIRAINECNSGKEQIVPTIVQLCFALLESANVENNGCDTNGELMGIEELGIQLLKTLFEVHDMARNEIIEQCKFRLLSMKPQQSKPIIKLLDYLVQSYPYPMLEYVSHLKELLDYFTFMDGKTSIHFIKVILPLVKFSHAFQDYIILVLRKAMFRREDSVRASAINAIVELISLENKLNKDSSNHLQDSSSQASCSQQAEIRVGMGGNLFQELSGLLRRCLSQQARVKEVLYQGLMKLVVMDPLIAGSVFDLLWPHFLKFYCQESGSLQIDSCFMLENGKVCVLEPINILLLCISWILLLQPQNKSDRPSQHSWPCFGFSISQENEAGRASSGELFSVSISKIRKSLVKYKLEDISCQNQEHGTHSSQGEKTMIRGWIFLGVIEVVINTIASELEKATEKDKCALEKEIIDLVDLYYVIEKEVENKQNGARKRTTTQDVPVKIDGGVSMSKLPQTRRSVFSTSTIHQLLFSAVKSYKVARFCDKASQNHTQTSSSKKLEQYLKLISFALKACLCHLRSKSTIESHQINDPLNVLIYENVKCLAQPLMQLVWLFGYVPKFEVDTAKKETKGKKHSEAKGDQSLQSLLCLNELFKLSTSVAHLLEMIEDLNSLDMSALVVEGKATDDECTSNQNLFELDDSEKSMHFFVEKKLKTLFNGYITLSRFREIEVICELTTTIGKKWPHEQKRYLGNWVVGICKSKKVENISASRSLVSLAFYILPAPNDLLFAQDLASELLMVIGSEDTDPVDLSNIFPVINKSTKNVIANMLMHLFETSITNLDWALSKLKTSLENNSSSVLLLEEAIYSRSEALVNVISFCTEMNLKDSLTEQFLKLTAKIYKLLARMTKLRIAPKGCKQSLPGLKFQKLAEVTCKKLTSPLYIFMELVQRHQQENAENKGDVNKIKRENRCIPDLIYQIEDYERYLIQLSKVTKVNMLRHAKRSTARDFRITVDEKITTHEEENNQEDQAESNDEGSGNESENNLSAGSNGEAAIEDSENEKDDDEVDAAIKRAKMSHVVQESDEEG